MKKIIKLDQAIIVLCPESSLSSLKKQWIQSLRKWIGKGDPGHISLQQALKCEHFVPILKEMQDTFLFIFGVRCFPVLEIVK